MRAWEQVESSSCQVKLYNSLTREKNNFIPNSGNQVSWYACGPTVYDKSHMGHARSYISSDILRRVLSDYFNYDIFYVMNVTDIDDKIIKRARRNYLIDQYTESSHPDVKLLADMEASLKVYEEKFNDETDPDKKTMMSKILTEAGANRDVLQKYVLENKAGEELVKARASLVLSAFEPLSDWLDKQFGADVTDHKIFSALSQHFEEDFHSDMEALNVLPADVLTRVSQYVPEIIAFIEKIIENGYAYESNGSVYFDTMKFATSPSHEYAKLVPEAVGNLDALAEGEGDLSQATSKEKKSDRDFALWKRSNPGEPFWSSTWGEGRPGWHIECSAMAGDVLGSRVDIHTGGIDLKFPHHDNELAQSEAHYGCTQWINYFLHAGHLMIEGCKMSKSLKNFISIKDALQNNTSRQIRLAFLSHAWHSVLDYSTNIIKAAEQTEKMFNDFFLVAKDILRKPENVAVNAHNYKAAEKALQCEFLEKKRDVHTALCDSIDTAAALQVMQALVKQTNIYIGHCKQEERTPNHSIVKRIAMYLTKMLKIFGANNGEQEIGFPSAGASGGVNVEDTVMPYVNLLADFREEVRIIAREEKVTKILKACDEIRDYKLVDVGVKLEDQEGGLAPIVKLVDRETLIKEREQKFAEIEKKRKEKEEAKLKQQAEKAAKDAKAKVPPAEMFLAETDKYSLFDENGFPTHDAAGEKLSASQLKKLKKVHAQQEKLHQKFLKDNVMPSNGVS